LRLNSTTRRYRTRGRASAVPAGPGIVETEHDELAELGGANPDGDMEIPFNERNGPCRRDQAPLLRHDAGNRSARPREGRCPAQVSEDEEEGSAFRCSWTGCRRCDQSGACAPRRPQAGHRAPEARSRLAPAQPTASRNASLAGSVPPARPCGRGILTGSAMFGRSRASARPSRRGGSPAVIDTAIGDFGVNASERRSIALRPGRVVPITAEHVSTRRHLRVRLDLALVHLGLLSTAVTRACGTRMRMVRSRGSRASPLDLLRHGSMERR